MSTELNIFQKENCNWTRARSNPTRFDSSVLNLPSVLCFYLRKRMGRRTWIKIYSDKWLRGTIKNESLQTRGAFISLLAMASDSPYENKGEIFITFDTGYTDEQFAKILNTSVSQWKEIKQRLIDTQRISVDSNNIIHIVNWTKYQSEYERQKQYREKLQPKVTKKVTDKKQETRNKNKNILKKENNKKNKCTKKQQEALFISIWDKYPNKDGRKLALKHFISSVKSQKDWDNINKALTNYKKMLDVETWKNAKNGSTWFNNWEDWINYKPPPERKDYGIIKGK